MCVFVCVCVDVNLDCVWVDICAHTHMKTTFSFLLQEICFRQTGCEHIWTRYLRYVVWTTDGASALSVSVGVCVWYHHQMKVQYNILLCLYKISTLTNNHVIVLSGKLGKSVGGILREGLWFGGCSTSWRNSLTFWKIHFEYSSFCWKSTSFWKQFSDNLLLALTIL